MTGGLFAVGRSVVEIIQAAGNLHQRFVQCFEGAVRALFGVAAQRFKVAQIGRKVGQHRHVGDVRAGREVVAGIGVENGLGCLPGRFDDIFVVRSHIVFDRRHARIEFRRHACGLHLNRLADQRREMGDLVFKAR